MVNPPEWGPPYGSEDLAIDPKAGRLYASSAKMDAVLVFDLKGARIAVLKPNPPEKLEGAGALALLNGKLYVLCTYGNRVVQINP